VGDLMLESSRPAVGTLAVHSPYDGRELGQLATSGPEHVDDALAAAHALFRGRSSWLSIPRRLEILARTAEIMASEVEELTLLAASEGGKPYSDSKVEVIRAIDGVHLCAETLRSHPGDVIPIGTTAATVGRVAFTRKEPIGIVAAVSAFNHPLNLIVHQVGPAVASGCPVVVKPAADTPLSCIRFVEILREAGLPDAWAQVVITDDRETADALVTDSRLGFFSFIGSGGVGWMLRSKLAPGVRCALEHGGAAPVILAPPYDREAALAAVVKGGFYHAGQVCVSVQRVFVDSQIARELADRLAALAKSLKVGDPTEPDTEVGPLIRNAEVPRVDEWVQEAVGGGGHLLCGGKALSASCFAPTVLFDPPIDARVGRQEIFGPVVCVYPFDEIDEAIAQANDLPYAFQAAIFTRDLDVALRASTRLDASAVMVNDHTAFRVDWMPFGGLRQSGLGMGGIGPTMRDMTVERMVVFRSPML